MVNDDKAFLRITASGVLACGSPWTGKHGLGSNICLPLQGICFLRRGAETVIRQADPAVRLDELRHQSFIPEDGAKALALAETLSRRVPLWEMTCTKEPAAARIAYQAMSGEEQIYNR